MKLNYYAFTLQLEHEFTIARGSTTEQETLIVELEHEGHRGYGESTTNPYYGHSIEEMVRSLEQVRPIVEGGNWDQAESLWTMLDEKLSADRFAQNALDQAAHDLCGKQQAKAVWQQWDLAINSGLPVSNYTIGIDDIETMAQKLDSFADWPVFKIKLGTENDLEIVSQLRERTDAKFRVDANCGWTAEETIEKSSRLKQLGVEFIEQPLPADDWDGMAMLSGQTQLPILADESCIEESDVHDCFHAGFNGINIKLCKCGGLTPARRMIAEARKLGMSVMVGCMTESTVGISAIAQLLPLLDFVDMDGATLLKQDIASGVRLEKGECIYPDVPGTGVKLTETGRQII